MKFLVKAMVQKGLSYIPFGSGLNEQLRKKNVQKKVPFNSIRQCIKQMEILHSVGFSIGNKVLLELGPGWKPVYALIYKLMGVKKYI